MKKQILVILPLFALIGSYSTLASEKGEYTSDTGAKVTYKKKKRLLGGSSETVTIKSNDQDIKIKAIDDSKGNIKKIKTSGTMTVQETDTDRGLYKGDKVNGKGTINCKKDPTSPYCGKTGKTQVLMDGARDAALHPKK